MVEVLTAVSLLGIVTAVAATNFTAMRPAFRTRGAALAIAGDLNQARMSAIKEARVYEYLPVSGGYQIRRDDGAGGRVVVKSVVLANSFPHVAFSYSAVTNQKDPYNADIASANAAATITFHSNGTIQNATGVFVAASDSEEPIQQAVTLSAAGRVRVWKYSDGEWH